MISRKVLFANYSSITMRLLAVSVNILYIYKKPPNSARDIFCPTLQVILFYLAILASCSSLPTFTATNSPFMFLALKTALLVPLPKPVN
jgi:hypothetical protein